MKKSFFESDKFAKVLAEDVIQAKQRMEKDPTDSHRREFVRATHSAIEAQYWQLKIYLIDHILDIKTASVHEISALKEESYTISNKGEIQVQTRGYPLKTGLRLIFSVLKRHRIPVHVDFDSPEWKNLDHAVKIRNRVTHPKNMADISVSKEEAESCYQAFMYVHSALLATIIGSALAVMNTGQTTKSKRSFFSRTTKNV